MKPSQRLILATEAVGLPREWDRVGFTPVAHEALIEALGRAGLWIGPRHVLEETEQFRQIIPYVVVVRNGAVVSYRRGDAGSEARLHGKSSIGFGGHVDFSDIVRRDEDVDLEATLKRATARELTEELGVGGDMTCEWLGAIMDDTTAVGRVHVGAIGVFTLDDHAEIAPEPGIQDVRYEALEDLQRRPQDLEGWSALIVPHLDAHIKQGTPSRRPL